VVRDLEEYLASEVRLLPTDIIDSVHDLFDEEVAKETRVPAHVLAPTEVAVDDVWEDPTVALGPAHLSAMLTRARPIAVEQEAPKRTGKRRPTLMSALVLAAAAGLAGLAGGVALWTLPRMQPPTAPTVEASGAPVDPVPAPAEAPSAEVATGRIRLSSRPVTDVYVGKEKIGRTPLEDVRLPVGKTTLLLRNAGLGIKKTIRVQIVADETVTRNVVFGKGSVALVVRPWADVFVADRNLGQTPMPPFSLYEGEHEILLRNRQLKKRKRITVRVQPGRTTRVSVDL
jgi:hypothetical protein